MSLAAAPLKRRDGYGGSISRAFFRGEWPFHKGRGMIRVEPKTVFSWIGRGLGGIVSMICIEVEEGTPAGDTEIEYLKGHVWRLQEAIRLLDPDYDGTYDPVLTPRLEGPDGEKREASIKASGEHR